MLVNAVQVDPCHVLQRCPNSLPKAIAKAGKSNNVSFGGGIISEKEASR